MNNAKDKFDQDPQKINILRNRAFLIMATNSKNEIWYVKYTWVTICVFLAL